MQDQLKETPTSANDSPVVVIGCGGIGGWLLSALDRTLPNTTQVIIYDKDKLEERNLDRQLFSSHDIGRYKAKAVLRRLTSLMNVSAVTEWFTEATEIPPDATVFCCADNHRARLYAWQAVNRFEKSRLIVGANEYTDAEAYYYAPWLRDTPADMLRFYPEIASDKSGAPTERCTGVAQEIHPQLAISNMLAAGYMMWLYWFWAKELPKLNGFPVEETPIRVSGNFSRIRTTLVKEYDVINTRPTPGRNKETDQ